MDKLPILYISSGRRLNLFKSTIDSLLKYNPEVNNFFSKVWIADDRSSNSDRSEMTDILRSFFGDKSNMICFNSEEPFAWVDKFNFIKKITNPDDFVFLIEDDWLSVEKCELFKHLNYMTDNPDITQILFTGTFSIQTDLIKENNDINTEYWSNPYPEEFKHVYKFKDDWVWWHEVRLRHYSNNPSLTRAKIFHEKDFVYGKNFETDFADSNSNMKQIFTKTPIFRHIGENQSLVNN